ncbi:PaaX domain-containing protein, C- domain protein [Mycolicibacterium austroafricanum]|uniref:PaaX family transcriptional regulator C-terminal domain-containing protein n=3 Tax=Mycolicibacterium TaxID=1866885 RepID=A0ABT8H6E2_MYCAO|nr:PaaX family transcriptional regulator C-terminal domain-containing protein [Mycolicibacterium austroafricanum]MDN4516341.1 PaaX family transcriptional regulator C-terminal domain-containing protein [Mycolicibacterium austroafricanum]QRZ07924.1 PaaX domain-containing protein, C- domain protein [Mycolicibacterium austroafricanum]QZT69588.1 PaaX domain-containing protein, C- domain protein [Mycolicibacterium austroafricanum]
MRMTARSVVLSVLLGAHPAWATAAELIRLTSDFGIRESTVRVALTRMVSAGDLVRSEDGYRLSDRLLVRQRRQDDAITPRRHAWDGNWTMLVITSVGTDARTRAQLRNALQDNRFAELREGVWMRPANVDLELGPDITEKVRILAARDDEPAELAARLWDLPGWAATGRELLTRIADADDVPGRFVVAAAMVRHLLTDPVLPDELLATDWPGAALRSAYNDFAAEMVARRDGVELMEAR